MNPCDDLSVDLLRYLENELSGQELKHFLSHLETCSSCQARLEQERALSGVLRESRPLYAAPAELRMQISAMEEESAQNNSRSLWLQYVPSLASSWKVLVPATLAIILCLIAVPNIVQNVRAASYVETAVANHERYLNGTMNPEIRTSSAEVVTAWFAGKVPFQFRLPSSEATLKAAPSYKLSGASLVDYGGNPVAMVVYDAPSGKTTLLVASAKSAVVAGGNNVRFGTLIFHYYTKDKFKVITWNNHDLSYALVSSIASSPQESCMVCHQSMGDGDRLAAQP